MCLVILVLHIFWQTCVKIIFFKNTSNKTSLADGNFDVLNSLRWKMIPSSHESSNFCAPKLPDTCYNWNMIIDKLNMPLDFWVVTARSFFSCCVVTKEVRKQQCRVRVEVFRWYTAHFQYRGGRTRNWTAG